MKLFVTFFTTFFCVAVLLSTCHPQSALAQTPQIQNGEDQEGDEPDEVDESDQTTNDETDESPAPATTAENPDDASTEINVKNADLGAIIKIFSKKTKRNYILDEKVKGKVSIFLPARISDTESIRILEAILSLKGFTSVPIGPKLWKILPIKEAKQSTIPTITGEVRSPTAAVVTRLIRLKHAAAEDIQQLLAPLVSPDGLINSLGRSNSLLIIDSEDNTNRLLEIARAVDIPSNNTDMTVIPIANADAKDIAQTLQDILGDDSDARGASGGRGGGRSEAALDLIRARARESAIQNNGMPPGMNQQIIRGSADAAAIRARGQAPKIIPDERTNSIIIVADETDTARIRALIHQLDSKVDLSGFRFYVYRCQHAKAEDLAEVLAGITGASTSSPSSSGSSSESLAGDSSTGSGGSRSGTGLSAARTQNRIQNQRRTPGQSRPPARSGSGASSGANFGEGISITADPATNSLVIASSRTDYEKIIDLLKQLDIKRRQVLVEAVLLEVGVTDSQKLGTEFLASGGGKDGGVGTFSNYGNLQKLLTDPVGLGDFSIAAASAGSLTLPGNITIPTQAALITAVRSNSNVNVLSSPTLLTTDNEQAEIVVGQNVPFLASTSTSETNLNNTFNQVDRQDVGITLRLTPQISSSDIVTLHLFTEVSNVVNETASSSLGPTTTIRTSETTVITKNNQMVVIGGLMSDSANASERGIPFLKDLPILGHLFKVATDDKLRTNLLIFITPRIIKDQYDHRDITVAQRDRLEADITANSMQPNRADILHSDAIDDVGEITEYDGPKPSTIRGPMKPESSHRLSFEQEAQQDQGTIELKVAPKLPDEARGAIDVPRAQASEQHARYIVGQCLNCTSDKIDAPFSIEPQKKLAVLILPSDSASENSAFFKAGQTYVYGQGTGGPQLRIVDIYDGETQAQAAYPGLRPFWYNLSRYEILNLGSGPWYRAEG